MDPAPEEKPRPLPHSWARPEQPCGPAIADERTAAVAENNNIRDKLSRRGPEKCRRQPISRQPDSLYRTKSGGDRLRLLGERLERSAAFAAWRGSDPGRRLVAGKLQRDVSGGAYHIAAQIPQPAARNLVGRAAHGDCRNHHLTGVEDRRSYRSQSVDLLFIVDRVAVHSHFREMRFERGKGGNGSGCKVGQLASSEQLRQLLIRQRRNQGLTLCGAMQIDMPPHPGAATARPEPK